MIMESCGSEKKNIEEKKEKKKKRKFNWFDEPTWLLFSTLVSKAMWLPEGNQLIGSVSFKPECVCVFVNDPPISHTAATVD